ncbi:unnamed protein product [Staurois parvus]|uniref:Uncharacterized protein n=1 Tax=Staurois parvus TaxID=386267 RepID=A0ABN9B3L1_9NEOB|nr:unnamed protein product [Staurois parvus]
MIRPSDCKTEKNIDFADSWLATSAHCVPQHALTPLCHFTWPTTWWLSCCCSQLLPLCYNTTNSWPWNI